MKHNFKRCLGWLMALALLLALLPGAVRTAYAAGEVANVDGVLYTDIDDALTAWGEAAGDSTLTLLADAAASVYGIISSDTKTIDLNGFTLSGDLPLVVWGGSLIVQDSRGGGCVKGDQAGVYMAGGTLTQNSGSIGEDDKAVGIYAENGDITINGGAVRGWDSAIYAYGDPDSGYYGDIHLEIHNGSVGSAVSERGVYGFFASVTMDGGSVTAGAEVAMGVLGVPDGSTVDISDGTIAYTGSNVKNAVQLENEITATISGGTITSTANGVYVGNFSNPIDGKKTLNVTGGTITADNVGIGSNGTAQEDIEINISGGSVTGGDTALYSPNETEVVNISGGTLTGGNGITVKGGQVNVSGDATITADGAAAAAGWNVSGFDVTGDAVYMEDSYGYGPIVTISGGTVESDNGFALRYFADDANQNPATGYIEVTGGSFGSPQTTSELNDSSLDEKIILSGGFYDGEPDADDLAPGLIAVQLQSGKWTIGNSYFAGYSLSLMGDIAINCYVSLGTGDLALDAASTTLELSYLGVTDLYDFSTLTVDAATGYYKFSMNFAAKEMSKTVTATLRQNGTLIEEKTFSIAGYASAIVENEGGKYDSLPNFDKLQPLCRAMIVYGAKAQTLFNYNTGDPADASLGAYTLDAVDESTLPAYPVGTDLSAFGVEFTASSLVLETETTHRLYFDVTDASLLSGATIRCGSRSLTAVVSGSTAYVDIPDIASRNVLKNYTLTFTNGTDTAKLKVNAGSYIKNALATGSDALKDAVTGLYWYSIAADAYFSAT